MPILKRLKQGVLQSARTGGLFSAVAESEWRRRHVLIIGFHSFSLDCEHGWRRALYFTPGEFEARLDLLERCRATVLGLAEALERLSDDTLPPRSVVLTFDDGQVDFLRVAWPMLRQRGYPATVYATTYYGEQRLPIFPLMCSYVLWKARHRTLPPWTEAGVDAPVDLHDEALREETAERIVAHARRDRLTPVERDARTRRLAESLDVNYDTLVQQRVLQVMTPEEMAAASGEGLDVQLHTHRHRVPHDPAAFAAEIADNRERLERWTGKPALDFCYPSGIHFPECLHWLPQLGVRSAVTCTPALAARESSPYLLPRLIDTASLTDIEVEGWVTGFSQCLVQRRTPDGPMPTPGDRVAPR